MKKLLSLILIFTAIQMSIPKVTFADCTVTTTASANNIAAFGVTGRVMYAGSLIPTCTGTIQTFTISLSKNGSPVDNVQMSLENDSAGKPANVKLITASVGGASVGSTQGDITFTFASPQSVTSGTQYWIVMDRSGALDGTNDYIAGGNTALGPDWASTLGTGTWDQQEGTVRMVFTITATATFSFWQFSDF